MQLFYIASNDVLTMLHYIKSSSIYIKLKSRLSVCLSTFHSGRSAISRTTLRIEAVFAPHEVLII